jgi:hypothetical protein
MWLTSLPRIATHNRDLQLQVKLHFTNLERKLIK